nr:hypothetical protein [Lachnospiraceae bacterium]
MLFRPTTRVNHGYASIEAQETYIPKAFAGFKKDAGRFVIFPRLSYKNHGMMEERNIRIGEDFSSYALLLAEEIERRGMKDDIYLTKGVIGSERWSEKRRETN